MKHTQLWISWIWLRLITPGPVAAQGIDSFANALNLTDQPLTHQGYYGQPATAEAGEPPHAGSPAAQSIWFQWKAPADGVYAFGEWTNGLAARISIYTGSELLALTSVAEGVSRVPFQAQAGVRYRIALDSPNLDVYYLRAYPKGGADEMADADVISGTLPLRVHGNNMLATTSPTDEIHYPDYPPKQTVWWRWTAPASGAVRVDGRYCDFGTLVDVYEQVPAGTPVWKTSGLVTFGMMVTAGNQYWLRFDVFMDGGPGEIDYWMEWMPTTPPPNDNIAAATDLGSAPIACDGGWIFFATPEAGLPQEDVGQWGLTGDRTLWWKWTCPQSGFYRFSTRGSDMTPEVLVYTGTPAALSIITGLENPDGVRIQATAGTQYWVKLRDNRYRCTRSELNIHPAETETAYFEQLDNRAMFRLHGPHRHPAADPDGDAVPNQVELAFYGNLEVADPNNPYLPRLVPSGTNWKLRWAVDSNYLTRAAGPDIEVKGQISSDLDGTWQTPVQIHEGTGVYHVTLPTGGRGFARLSIRDPNLELPAP